MPAMHTATTTDCRMTPIFDTPHGICGMMCPSCTDDRIAFFVQVLYLTTILEYQRQSPSLYWPTVCEIVHTIRPHHLNNIWAASAPATPIECAGLKQNKREKQEFPNTALEVLVGPSRVLTVSKRQVVSQLSVVRPLFAR